MYRISVLHKSGSWYGSGILGQCGSRSRSGSRSGSTGLMTKHCTRYNFTAEKTYFFYKKLAFIFPLASMKHVQATVQEKPPALKKNIQHFKTRNSLLFSILVGRFCPLWSGSSRKINDNPCGSGSTSLRYIQNGFGKPRAPKKETPKNFRIWKITDRCSH